MKLSFEQGPDARQDSREISSILTKLRSRFKVAVLAETNTESQETEIVISALAPNQNALTQLLDHTCEFIENSGFGRILSEVTLFDHIDSIEEDQDTYSKE